MINVNINTRVYMFLKYNLLKLDNDDVTCKHVLNYTLIIFL